MYCCINNKLSWFWRSVQQHEHVTECFQNAGLIGRVNCLQVLILSSKEYVDPWNELLSHRIVLIILKLALICMTYGWCITFLISVWRISADKWGGRGNPQTVCFTFVKGEDYSTAKTCINGDGWYSICFCWKSVGNIWAYTYCTDGKDK
jgi:hypothetical protein